MYYQVQQSTILKKQFTYTGNQSVHTTFNTLAFHTVYAFLHFTCWLQFLWTVRGQFHKWEEEQTQWNLKFSLVWIGFYKPTKPTFGLPHTPRITCGRKHLTILTQLRNEVLCLKAPQQPITPMNMVMSPTMRTVTAAAQITWRVPWSLATLRNCVTLSSTRNQIPTTTRPSPANYKHNRKGNLCNIITSPANYDNHNSTARQCSYIS